MLRLYTPEPPAADGTIRIPRAELRHLHALRLGPGDRLCVFDDAGHEHEVVLDRVTTREAMARVVATSRTSRESPLELVLVPALVKHERMDWVVEKATELGVVRIAPLITRYTVALGNHAERWRRIALAAAKQCGRTRIPTVDAPRPLAAVLGDTWPGLRLVAWEEEHAARFADLPDVASAVTLLIGPEGGLDAAEVAAARAAGFTTVTLGHRVLRADTAAVVAMALCQQRWGDG
jgi:16S rRNA (uracil1498-N3)-methyltransferase